MKFRYRGGSRGFVARKVGRAVGNAYSGSNDGGCLIIAFLFALITGSPILALVILGAILSILPTLILYAVVALIVLGVYYGIRTRYFQIFVSWFFLKEDEIDGTILSFGEIKSRIKGFFSKEIS
jgi:hypothetical protein